MVDGATLELREVHEITVEGAYHGPALCGTANLSNPDDLMVQVDAADSQIGIAVFEVTAISIPLTVTVLTTQRPGSREMKISGCGVIEPIYRGRDALAYLRLAERYRFADEPLTNVVSLFMAQRLGSLAPNVRTAPALQAVERASALPVDWEQRAVPLNGLSAKLLSLGTLSTLTDISLWVRYRTTAVIGQSSGSEEADRLPPSRNTRHGVE